MSNLVTSKVAEYFQGANEARQRAEQSGDKWERAALLDIEKRWLDLAESYRSKEKNKPRR
jgi:hypothetical protein